MFEKMNDGSPNIFSGSLIPQMKTSLALTQRKIYLYDDVEENSIFECIYYLNKLADIDSVAGEKLPINIYINSNGGLVSEGFSLIGLMNTMQDNGYEINTINMSKAFSMGFVISVCGTNRYATRYCSYMYHDISSMTWGKAEQMKEDMEYTFRLREMCNEIILKNTKLTSEDLKFWLERKQDKFFNAKEAIELGITDKII